MANDWIPVREALPTDTEWVQVQTQDGTVYPACYIKNTWSPLFRGGLVDHLMHGKVAYWKPHDVGYPYVQCKCGAFYLQAEGRKTCPICASFGIVPEVAEKPKRTPRSKKVPDDEIPFAEEGSPEDDLLLMQEDES